MEEKGEQTEKNDKKAWVVSAVLLILVAIGGLTLYIMHRQRTNQQLEDFNRLTALKQQEINKLSKESDLHSAVMKYQWLCLVRCSKVVVIEDLQKLNEVERQLREEHKFSQRDIDALCPRRCK